MAYNTKPIAKDKDGNPISQYYNPTTDQYEPVEGSYGANKVLVENNDLSLIPILDKLSQLTGTVIDEETRKSNEVVRQDNEQLRVQLYSDLMAELDRIAQIQEQVPETVIDSINDIKAESATWIRIDTLSAPIELPSGGIEDAISVPTSEIISGDKVYAIEFKSLTSDTRSSSISICAGLTDSASGIIVGSPINLTEIFVANRFRNPDNPNEILFYALRSINGNIVPCYVYRIFRLKEGVRY